MLRNDERRNSKLIVGSNAVNRIGDLMFDFANITFLANLNHKSMYIVGIYQILDSLIGIIFNILGGVFADRYRRQKLIAFLDAVSGIVCILLSFLHSHKYLVFGIIIANVFLTLLNCFSGPAYKAFTKEIVEKKNINVVNSYLQIIGTVVKITVPVLSMRIYNYIGISGVLLLNGVSFLSSSLLIILVRPINVNEILKEESLTNGVWDEIVEGVKYLINRKKIFTLVLLTTFTNFLLAGYNLLIPYGNQMFPEVKDNIYGLFLVGEAIGGLLGATLSGIINKNLKVLKIIMCLGLSGLSLCSAPFIYLFTQNGIIIACSPTFFSMFLTIFNLQFLSVIQREVENQLIGRVFGIVFTLVVLFMPVGTMVFSILLKTNFAYNFDIIGLLIIFISFVFYSLFKKIN